MAIGSISETQRVRYMLGLASPAEREHIESELFEDEAAFQEMLTAEDDLIDAYARGELMGEERRRFEERFGRSLRERGRVKFARAFAGAVSASQPVETRTWPGIFKPFRSSGLLRTAAIAVMIVFVAVLAWLVIDRRRMTNELRDLRAESERHSKQTKALQRSSDNEQSRTAQLTAIHPDLRVQPDKRRHRERLTTPTQQARHLPEVKNQEASLGNSFEPIKITKLPVNVRDVSNLLSLQPEIPRGGRIDQTNITLDLVDVHGRLNTSPSIPRNASSGGNIVRGKATDPNGNLVRGAIVTLTDSARNFTRTQSTNENGAYVFNAIPPGTYSIEVQARGFKTTLVSGVAALVDTPTVQDVALEIGAISETIDVTSAAEAAINTYDATIGNSFESQRITELPLNANNVVSLLSLQPDVSRTGFVNGERTDQSNIRLDGVVAAIRIPSSLSWIRFQIALATTAIHDNYRVTIKTADGRPVTSVDWIEPLTPNQTIIDTPAIVTGDLPSGNYVLVLSAKGPDGSFVKVAEYSFKVIKLP